MVLIAHFPKFSFIFGSGCKTNKQGTSVTATPSGVLTVILLHTFSPKKCPRKSRGLVLLHQKEGKNVK